MSLTQLKKIEKEHETTGKMNYTERNAFQNKQLDEEEKMRDDMCNEDDLNDEDKYENDEFDENDYKEVSDGEGGHVFVQLTRAEVADNKKRKRNSGGSTSSEGSGGVDCLEKVTQKAIERAVVASEKASAAAVSANVASNAVAMLNAENEKQRIALATAQLAASTAREEANAAHSTRLMEQMFQFMRDNQQQARQDVSNQQTRK